MPLPSMSLNNMNDFCFASGYFSINPYPKSKSFITLKYLDLEISMECIVCPFDGMEYKLDPRKELRAC